MIVRDKPTMYRMARAGAFGNCVPRYFTIREWGEKGDQTIPLWGVQTTRVPGGPCRLNCPTAEVEETFARFAAYDPVISPMLSAGIPTLWAGDVWDGPAGLELHGLLAPPLGFDWRAAMRTDQRQWTGSAALALLRHVMNGNTYADFEDLRDAYPGHVYEYSVFERECGTVPGRNGVVWEVRAY